MLTPKYFERIRELASKPPATDVFDFSVLGKGGGLGGLARNRTLHAFLRVFWPTGRIGRFGWVARHADVADVRRRKAEFMAPYGEEMVQLTGGRNFVLGMEDGPEYRRQLRHMAAAILPADIPNLIAPNAARLSQALLDYSGGEIDAVEDLLFRVAAETCADYFGLEIEDPVAFAQWLMSLSALLFADYFGDAATHQLARAGAARLRRVIDSAIVRGHAILVGRTDRNVGPEETAARDAWSRSTVIGRLVALQVADPAAGPSDDEIRAIVMGTAVGYVPTGGGAGGNILDVLLDRPEWLLRAQTAAAANDDATLGKILSEAMRFSPPINPGLPRYVKTDAKIGGTTFPAGSAILVAAMSAMFDGRVIEDPNAFNPDRDVDMDLQFGGDYLHQCFGEAIARALLLESFKPLLRQKRLRRAAGKSGRKASTGPFPQHLNIVFVPATGQRHQSMVTICIPVTEPVLAADIDKELDRLGNPAIAPLRTALDGANRIHFAHISAIEGERGEKGEVLSPAFLIVEFTADGDTDSAIDCLVDAAADHVMRVFTLATGVATADQLKRLCKDHVRKLVPGRLFAGRSNASGVNFPGTPELSVTQIESARKLSAQARACLDRHLANRKGRGGLASPALASVREQIKAGAMRPLLARPSGQDLAVSRREDRSLGDTLGSLSRDPSVVAGIVIVLGVSLGLHFLLETRRYTGFQTPDDIVRFALIAARAAGAFAVGATAGAVLMTPFLLARRDRTASGGLLARLSQSGLIWTALTALLGIAVLVVFQPSIGVPAWDEGSIWARLVLVARVGSEIVASLVVGLLVFIVFAALVIGGLLILLRRSETDGAPEDLDPPLKDVQALLRRENQDGYLQNHLIAVTPLKTNPRWLRRFTLSLAFWGIAKLVQHRFRPGFVLDIGTIHYARWFRLPGTDKLVFLSNYDGSWESYLEDFITKAHLGQTAVWSNGVGFPETRFLLLGGAQDGARFKRWVRRQQIESRFWYSRFPDLTTDQMRTQALICEGLAKARTESEAQAWLDLFGSQPRPLAAMEYDEVQSIVFSGMGKLRASELIPIRFPDNNAAWPEWLRGLIGSEGDGAGAPPAALRVTFGETPPVDRALALALSPRGLQRMGLAGLSYHAAGQPPGTTADTFPAAFMDGMASKERARILGDHGTSSPDHWPWAREGEEPDAVLLVYAETSTALAACAAEIRRDLRDRFGFTVLDGILTEELGENPRDFREPFGFRDGISQPIIRGARPLKGAADAMNTVEPGEFVLGYPDNRGDTPPSPLIAAEHDPDILPDVVGNLPGRFPDFEGGHADAPRDFGRNGTYLVIRQLEQDVAGFHAQADEQARRLNASFAGARVDGAWIESRLVGRWPNGSSLVRHPLAAPTDEEADNDFLFGQEDPQGLRCPYGAHVRRAFPRDSLSPDNADQLSISNRHRLMRRGRPYMAADARPQDKAKGILFMCLNADIERQFEFVQQTWITSPTFHGLAGEPDPVAAAQSSPAAAPSDFSIPTSLGPMSLRGMQSYVTVRNGGYFFVPSWSALRFLATLAP